MHGTGRVKSAELSGLIVIKSLYLVDVEYLFREYVFKLKFLKMAQRTCFEDEFNVTSVCTDTLYRYGVCNS